MSAPLVERLNQISEKLPDRLAALQTEEATKNALVMPFLSALGYDVFDPTEVVPEFTADVGTKKGEKVDYAIKRGDEVIMLVEAKQANQPLSHTHSSQLYRYFSVTKARIAILTNGVQYRFYSDIEEPNRMDRKPFLEIDMLDLREPLVQELTKLSNDAFDLDDMLTAASGLKYMREIRKIFELQLEDPEEDFVKFFFSKANPNGRFVQSVKGQFADLVKKTLHQVISERVGARLRSALERESEEPRGAGTAEQEVNDDSEAGNGVVTTEEELEAFRIVKAVVCRVVAPNRVVCRDTKSYFGVLLDDNNRKPICRLHLNRSKKYIGLLDAEKQETRHVLSSLSDIYKFADSLCATAERYDASTSNGSDER